MSNTDYRAENPFEEEDLKTPPPLPAKNHEPVFQQQPPQLPKRTAPSSLTFPGETELTTEELDRKERELNQREQNLKVKETSLTQRENNLKGAPAKNWPRCRPIIYHDIREEIPTPELQTVVRRAYWGWYALSIVYLWNFITMFAVLVVDSSSSAIGSFILSILYLVVSIPIGFLIYRTLYRGAKNAKTSWFVLYFCLIWTEIAIWIIFAIGLSGSGGVGFFTMINLFQDDQKSVGIMCLVTFILWVLIVLYHVYIFVIARLEFRKLGGIRQAQKEAAREAGHQAAQNPEFVKAAIQASV